MIFGYSDISDNSLEGEPQKHLTDVELLMQVNADADLRDLEIQQNQELLAQQMAEIELIILGGNA